MTLPANWGHLSIMFPRLESEPLLRHLRRAGPSVGSLCLRQFFQNNLHVLPVLQQRMRGLEDRAAQGRATAECIMTSWAGPSPSTSTMPSQRPPSTCHEAHRWGLALTTLGAATCRDNELHAGSQFDSFAPCAFEVPVTPYSGDRKPPHHLSLCPLN